VHVGVVEVLHVLIAERVGEERFGPVGDQPLQQPGLGRVHVADATSGVVPEHLRCDVCVLGYEHGLAEALFVEGGVELVVVSPESLLEQMIDLVVISDSNTGGIAVVDFLGQSANSVVVLLIEVESDQGMT